MRHLFQRLRKSEDGAVTVDWVVLTAAIVGLGVGIVTVVASAATDKSSGLGAHLSAQSIATY